MLLGWAMLPTLGLLRLPSDRLLRVRNHRSSVRLLRCTAPSVWAGRQPLPTTLLPLAMRERLLAVMDRTCKEIERVALGPVEVAESLIVVSNVAAPVDHLQGIDAHREGSVTALVNVGSSLHRAGGASDRKGLARGPKAVLLVDAD